jgi:hypothetical protein
MNRRTLLLAAPLAYALPGGRPARAALLDLFDNPARGHALGLAYLATLPHAPTPDTLAAAVMRALPGARALRTEVSALIRQDYAAGRIECLDGWLLSVTEARLCALTALP